MFKLFKKMTKPNAVITKFYTTVPRKVEGEPQKEYKHHWLTSSLMVIPTVFEKFKLESKRSSPK